MIGRERKGRGDAGGAMVEMAMIMPVLLLMLFGVMQYGFILSAYITVRNAASVGTRCALVASTSASCSDPEVTALGALGPMLSTDPNDSIIDYTDDFEYPAGSGEYVKKLEIQYPLRLFVPWVVPGSSGGILVVRGASIAR